MRWTVERNGSVCAWYRPRPVIVSSMTAVKMAASVTGRCDDELDSRNWNPSRTDWNSTVASISVSSSVRTER